MDWVTVATAVGSSLVGGGLIGGLVSLRVARREHQDRNKALTLERDKHAHEREKWEHVRALANRELARHACKDALDSLQEISDWVHKVRLELERAGEDAAARQQVLGALFENTVHQGNVMGQIVATLHGHDLHHVVPDYAEAAGKGSKAITAMLAGSNNVESAVEDFDRAQWTAAETLNEALRSFI